MNTLKAFLVAATAYLKVLPLLHLKHLEDEYDTLTEDIIKHGASGAAASLLLVESLGAKRRRLDKHIRFIRTTCGHTKEG